MPHVLFTVFSFSMSRRFNPLALRKAKLYTVLAPLSAIGLRWKDYVNKHLLFFATDGQEVLWDLTSH